MPTRGYLFEDDREREPYVLFMDGLINDEEEDEDELTSIEVRFSSLAEAINVIAQIQHEQGVFDIELGEPEHFEDVREGIDE